MSTVFEDLKQRDLTAQSEAQDKRARLTLVRGAVAGEAAPTDSPIESQDAHLAHVLALGTDAANFVIIDLASKCSTVRAFVDAVMGVTGGNDEFVFVTDEQLAARMGVSTKTVQVVRKKFMGVKNYSALIEIKRNFRDPKTHESFPHRYKCKLTALAVEAMQNAQLSPGWNGDTQAKMRAMRDAAETVARGASFGALTPPMKRRKQTDAEVVDSKLRASTAALEVAARRRPMVKNPDFDRLWELRQAHIAALAAFDEAYGFESNYSMQIQKKEDGSERVQPLPDVPAHSSRMESEDLDTEAENGGQVEASSTCNGSTESTTCEDQEISPTGEKLPPEVSSTTLYIMEGEKIVKREMAAGLSETEAREVARNELGTHAEWKQDREETFDRVFGGLKGGRRDE